MYEQVFKTAKSVLKRTHSSLGLSGISAKSTSSSIAINTLPWARSEIVDLSETEAGVASGSGALLTVKPFSQAASSDSVVSVEQTAPNTFQLKNSQFEVTVEGGVITSLYDIQNDREVIEPGQKANQYVVFDDKPLYWQAWDVEVYHLDTRKELPSGETSIFEVKPHRVTVATQIKISDKSSIVSYISLSAVVGDEQTAVVCRAEVDWHESMTFLKVEFPVTVRNTEASYESAYGVVKRPTHYNTRYV